MKYYLSSLLYPFREEAKYRLFFVIPIMWLYVFVGRNSIFGFIFQLTVCSYMAVYLMKMLHESVKEDFRDEMCEFPSPDWHEALESYRNFIMTGLFSYAPLLVGSFFFKMDMTVALLLFVLGTIYFPMALLRVTLTEDISELSPLGWYRSVRRIWFPYCGLVLFFSLLLFVLGKLMLLSANTSFIEFVVTPLVFLILAVSMNILGKFYRKHEEKMGW